MYLIFLCFFFFQAEDGIRDLTVTGVQTCALPISLHYIDARAAVDALSPGAWARMPYTARVHAENLVRRADPAQLDSYLLQLIERRRDIDFPWYPVRVVCHDILGQTALVDLAGLRDAIAAEG